MKPQVLAPIIIEVLGDTLNIHAKDESAWAWLDKEAPEFGMYEHFQVLLYMARLIVSPVYDAEQVRDYLLKGYQK